MLLFKLQLISSTTQPFRLIILRAGLTFHSTICLTALNFASFGEEMDVYSILFQLSVLKTSSGTSH